MRKLTIVFHHAGGGHRSTADALKAVLTAQAEPWDVSLLNIQELLSPLDLLRSLSGWKIEDTYNLILRRGWTRFSPQLLVILQATIRLYHRWIVRALQTHWSEHPADLVVSVIPHFNRALAESLHGPERVPFVTLLTDLADYPPQFWIEPESEYLIVATERAKQQAMAVGHAENRIFHISGMVLKPRFYRPAAVDRVAERKRFGLEPDCPTGIVLFGGHGSRVMLEIARSLDHSGVQLIMLCGHNQKLAAQLEALKTSKPLVPVGFTQNVESYMALADFFIGKPGPGSISEALQFGLPLIVDCNRKTLPQERYNAEWLTEKGFGIVVRSFREIAPAVRRLLEPPRFDELRANARTYSNRALFEVPAVLERCAERAGIPVGVS